MDFVETEGLNLLARTADVVGGIGQVLAGVGACSTGVGCVGGGPLAVLGASSIQEGWTGEPGFARSAATSVMGSTAGNLSIDTANIVTSATGLFKSTLRSDSWKLFHNVSSDFVPAYKTMTKTGLSVEIGGSVLSAAGTVCSYVGK